MSSAGIIINKERGNFMKINQKHPADIIVEVMNRLYDHRLTTTSGGNLSIMDDEGNMWISPSGVDKGNLTRRDIMCVKPDGSIVGPHKPSSEYPFHLAVLRARTDLRAVLHAHPPALVAYSLMRKIPALDIYPGLSDACGNMAIATYALPGSETLGEYIAREFRKGFDTVVLENHGVVIGAKSLDEAFCKFEALDFAARTGASAANLKKSLVSRPEGVPMPVPVSYDTLPCCRKITNEEIDKRAEMCTLAKRSYEHVLFPALGGTIACRLSDGGMLVTPNGEDLAKLETADIVYVKDGACENGKIPSSYAAFAKKVLDMHPDVEGVAFSTAPHIMAFACTEATFDSRLIPESYICLKNVSRFSCADFYNNSDKVASALSVKEPIAIIENECAIVCGNSLLNTYDRMEVMEYGAESICYTASVGFPIVRISDEEIRDIEVAFKL